VNQAVIKAILVLDKRLSSRSAGPIIDHPRIACELLDVEEFASDIQACDRAMSTNLALRALDVVLLDPALPAALMTKIVMRVRDKLPDLPVLILPQAAPALQALTGAEASTLGEILGGRAERVADGICGVGARARLHTRLWQLALKDELTGLHNRRGFTILAEQQLRVARAEKRPLLLFFADVDGLKQINDTFGHQAGDEALVLAANGIRRTFRGADVTARIGGDEFVALTPEGSNCTLSSICRRLHRHIATHSAAQRRYRLSVSLGVARFDPASAVCLKELMAQADRALYAQRHDRSSVPEAIPIIATVGAQLVVNAHELEVGAAFIDTACRTGASGSGPG
jgi:two-component system, cell cycle response regulator